MSGARYQLVSRLRDCQIRDLHSLYQEEWWTRGRTLSDVRRMLEHSNSVFGLIDVSSERLIAFARVLTDRVFKGMIFDVIVEKSHRNEGLGRRLMESIIRHPELEAVRHVELYCLPEMVPFYEKWGFSTERLDVTLMRRDGSSATGIPR